MERSIGSAIDYHPIKLPNLSYKSRKGTDIHNGAANGLENSDNIFNHDADDSSVERLPSAKGRVKVSRNSKMHKSRSMLTKNDDSANQEEEQAQKMHPQKRKIKIIHNSKGSKGGTKIKNSHMVILKSIKQKLNMQGMLKDSE